MRTNPGSVFELDVDESSGCFRRLFVAFHGSLYGFQFCRPLLFVDGTFFKGCYKGHLLAAILKDGNQDIYLFVVSIVLVCQCVVVVGEFWFLLLYCESANFCSFILFCFQACFLC